MQIYRYHDLRPAGLILAGLLLARTMCTGATAETPPLNDHTITLAIEEQLVLDPGVKANRVSVNTEAGIVTLTGTVDNLLASERATRLAETVKGVRAVINRTDLEASKHSDSEIRTDIIGALAEDAVTEPWQLDATVNHGRVTLTGTVESWAAKGLAATVAKGVRGVRSLDNQIHVDYAMSRNDEEIRREVLERMNWNPYVDDALIKVHVEDGRVELTGTVGSAAEKRAARSAAWVVGVEELDTQGLDVKYWARDPRLRKDKYIARSDEDIRHAVEAALRQDPRVNKFDVVVEVRHGKATLTGNVDHLRARRAAAQDARNTVGVWRVKNYLKVRGDTIPADADIAERVHRALERDPYLEPAEIHVSVTGGTVDLNGVVDTAFERAQADAIASGIRGVVGVNNRLTVDDDRLTYSPYVDRWYVYDYDWYRPSPRRNHKSDWEIAQDIREQLFWSPFVDSGNVSLEVEGGTVTLTGEVQSLGEYHAAEENAREGGAETVINKLDITYAPGYFTLW